MKKEELDKETALRRFNKGKKQFEKGVVTIILEKIVNLDKRVFEETGLKPVDNIRNAEMRYYYKQTMEMIDKKIGLNPRDAEIMPTENMCAYLSDDLVAERIYEKVKKLLPKYMKKLRVEQEEELLKKEHEAQKKRKKMGKTIWGIAKDIAIAFGQFRMGLYRDHIYDNMLWWVGNLRDTVKSLAEIDLSFPEYEETLSFKNFNLEKFLFIRGRSYYDDIVYNSEDGITWYLNGLRLGMRGKKNNLYIVPVKNTKEEYICALELVNRIEEEAKELIKDYTPAVSKKIIEIKLPQEPQPIILKCIECRWETTESISLCEVCGGKLENKGS